MKFTTLVALAAFAAAAKAQTIAEAVVAGNATTLAKVVGDLGLLDTLATLNDAVTVFAPTDAAFAALAATGVDLTNTALVTDVVKYHVVPGTSYTPTPGNTPLTTFLEAANGLSQTVVATNVNTTVSINFRLQGANVVASRPVNSGRGVVHFIDKVLLPPQPINEVAAAGNLTALVETIQAAGLLDTVLGLTNVTIFAPTNAAFAEIASVASTLTPTQLQQVLLYHVVPQQVFSNAIIAASSIAAAPTALEGATLAAAINGTDVTIAGAGNTVPAKVVLPDITFDGGVVHVIDKVLIPNFSTLPATLPAPKTTTRRAAASTSAAAKATTVPTTTAAVTTTAAAPRTTSTSGAEAIAPAGFAAAAVAVAALFI
ncbi:hypothetical protein HDU96_000666 [Phlyctochytrium bullatum]|nr:hypothetical protein HDU96_000666 [Phlyctochytrium bullatum]